MVLSRPSSAASADQPARSVADRLGDGDEAQRLFAGGEPRAAIGQIGGKGVELGQIEVAGRDFLFMGAGVGDDRDVMGVDPAQAGAASAWICRRRPGR